MCQMTQLCELINKSGEIAGRKSCLIWTHSLLALVMANTSDLQPTRPFRGINILRQAIDKMQMNSNHLTSLHADLCRCFKPTLLYLDLDMMDICKENGTDDSKHFLCYCMIHTGLKNFERESYFYEQVQECPNYPLPPSYNYSSHGRQSHYASTFCSAYCELARAYTTNGPVELRKVVTRHAEMFMKDSNMGLILKGIELDDRLKTVDQEITVNPQFIQKSTGSQDDDVGSKTSSFP
ncbi:COP9 signalosome complex subunit 3-like [Scleropages formosus]|uniref:COP9 signalosome complex subunit 3-like n=1 Tax=Scleropages formosus TaxID=113540 RepID=A0A0P7UIC9_SCLFO|nr:COP9 signalosome complex subunit 3-like [Scleropages formosus]